MNSRALLLGINDYKTVSDLRGCRNDVDNVASLLINRFDFPSSNLVKLFDKEVTKKNVKQHFLGLVNESEPGDRIVFHFSGHGSHIISDNEDEPVDELICLYDMNFSDSESYMTDDEIGDLLNKVPDGILLTVILDCCHSGSGTRAITRNGKKSKSATSRSILEIKGGNTRSLYPSRARFVTPPSNLSPELNQLVAKARKKATRRSAETFNHLLLAGAEDVQTAADAHIAGDFNGAFTYYLCETALESDSSSSAETIFKKTVTKIKSASYSQNPQIEGIGQSSPLFGPREVSTPAQNDSPKLASGSAGQLYQKMMDVAQEFFDENPSLENPTLRARSSSETWVAVHGISQHSEGYSNDWYNAMSPYLQAQLSRAEVLWSHHVNSRDVLQDNEIADEDEQILRARIEAALEDRGIELSSDDDLNDRDLERGFGFSLDDFIRYMLFKSVREKILDEFITVVKPLLAASKNIHITSHSWGTVVAYEGLRRIAAESPDLPGTVVNFFVAGSALSIGAVRNNLFRRVNDGRKPQNVLNWYNLDAKRDVVGGRLDNEYGVDKEYLGLTATGCSLIGFRCAHSSYFNPDNHEVNRGIFAAHINDTIANRALPESKSPSRNVEILHAQLRGVQEQIDDMLDAPIANTQQFAPIRSLSSDRSSGRPKLALVVGHTAVSGGAVAASPIQQNEYTWNNELANLIKEKGNQYDIEVEIFLRNSIGIAGAYRNVAKWGANAVIELHFNAFNGDVRGSETLFGTVCPDSEDWATKIQECVVTVFGRVGRGNRGLRCCPPWPRGGNNVNAIADIPICLIEPFFGDNASEADLAEDKKEDLAEGLVQTFLDFV